MIKLIDRFLNIFLNFFRPTKVSEDGKKLNSDVDFLENSLMKFKSAIKEVKALQAAKDSIARSQKKTTKIDVVEESRNVDVVEPKHSSKLKAKPFTKFGDGKAATYYDKPKGEAKPVLDYAYKMRVSKEGKLILSEKENSNYKGSNSKDIKDEFAIDYNKYRKILNLMYNKR